MDYIDQLKAKMATAGLTPFKVSKLAGITAATMYRILSRKASPNLKTITKIEAAIDAAEKNRGQGKP